MKTPVALLLIGSTLALVPGVAEAHLVSTRFGELYSGMLHPLTTLQHLVPWLALGLLGGLQHPETGRWALLAFPVAVLLGVVLAALAPGLGFVDDLNVLSFIVIGALVALAYRTGPLPLLTLVVFFGLTHGYANAAELSGFAWVLYLTGVGFSAYVLVALAAGSAQALTAGPGWGTIAVRAVGSWVAAAGVMYLTYLWLLVE